MLRIIVQILVNAIALWVAGSLMAETTFTNVWEVLVTAFVFGLLNTFIRPILNVLTCPFYILTLGLFTFVMNVIILWLTERITGMVDWGDFWNMLVAGIIVSIVSFLLNLFLRPARDAK